MSEKDGKRCENCAYWLPPADGTAVYFGECRAEPPQVGASGSQWPQTMPKQWCGEWEAAETTAPSVPGIPLLGEGA